MKVAVNLMKTLFLKVENYTGRRLFINEIFNKDESLKN